MSALADILENLNDRLESLEDSRSGIFLGPESLRERIAALRPLTTANDAPIIR